jgi:hypothetical protein
MPYQGTSKIAAQVSVCCEACGNNYTYDHIIKAGGQASDKYAAMALANTNLTKAVEKIKAGDYRTVADHKPCPKCGYVQSWMIDPVRRRRGMNWGCGLGFLSYLAVILITVFASIKLHLFDLPDFMIPVLFIGVPVVIIFGVRALVMVSYRPNKGREKPSQLKLPSVDFHYPS